MFQDFSTDFHILRKSNGKSIINAQEKYIQCEELKQSTNSTQVEQPCAIGIQVDPVQFSQNDSLSFAEYNESSLIEFLDKIESKFSDALLDNIKTQENFSNYFNAIFPERKVEMEDKDQDLVYKSQDYINYICWCGNYQFYAISNQSSSSNMSKSNSFGTIQTSPLFRDTRRHYSFEKPISDSN
ncbi:hypothetical protein ROZALSC1DRAFT_23298 [Rozella allomycis CSF55]|uniref:Uncharacterized protein n=1 Tax=Rozella allomycis (strain CSF55) TaxID=988480 RepID=A0A4P9YFY3_ROZAC|nr:hypothetical protein ROZALSC1DRAFT_23298 [Rozella allomycis CSF55]